jgi:hypothetical protein
MNITELSEYQLACDLKDVENLLWLYKTALDADHPKSFDGSIDYEEHYKKMSEIRIKIIQELLRRKEAKYVQLCE